MKATTRNMAEAITTALKKRFFQKVDKNGPLPNRAIKAYAGLDKCWQWTGMKGGTDYGRIKIKNLKRFAHRISWLVAGNEIPSGKWVLHKCDNTLCVNPSHLFIGDNLANSMDRMMKGRCAKGLRSGSYTKPERRPKGDRNGARTKPETRPRGEKHGMSKLASTDVVKIRRLLSQGVSQREIAKKFNVQQKAIFSIHHRKTWNHL